MTPFECFVTLSICIGFGILIYRFIQKNRYHKSDIYFMRIYDSVKEINAIVDQLQSIESMITEIEICNHNHLKAVKIEIPETISKNCDHEIIINGKDKNSRFLLQFAVSERDRLRTLLQNKIAQISRYGVTETITETFPENDIFYERGDREE